MPSVARLGNFEIDSRWSGNGARVRFHTGLAGVCFGRLRAGSLGALGAVRGDLITVFTHPPDSPPSGLVAR